MKRNNELLNRKVSLVNIDGLGHMVEEGILGIIVAQQDENKYRIKLDKELNYEGNLFKEINIVARHKGFSLDKIRLKGIRKFLNVPYVIAVNAFDDTDKIRFVAEIKLI